MSANNSFVFYEKDKMGIYIHFPYCIQKCSYCDFYSLGMGKTSFSQKEYFEVLHKELEFRLKTYDWQKFQVSSVFLGGGTPSLAEQTELKKLFIRLKENFNFLSESEWTLEANPEDVSLENLQSWKDLGINRINVGIQSFHKEVLNFLERYFDEEKYFQVLELLSKKIIPRYGIDLIYGIPNQTQDMFFEDVKRALQFGVQHLSCYALTVEKGTEYSRKIAEQDKALPNEDMQAEILNLLPSFLEKRGLLIYEVSNFAKEGFACIHNLQYWKMAPYLALGASAHGFSGNFRYANPRSIEAYIKGIFGKTKQVENLYEDFLLCVFRIMKKISLKSFETFWKEVKGFEHKLDSWSKQQICFWDGEEFQWNLKALPFLDSYILELASCNL
ncbi:MAG: radical SAM family heme chaperone HemW [Leptospiraceae bacterium]|nr:radical SAM family heme chaperone HemW [Leptospiraceae bacterium]